jgi:predicted protein tyrosine phosphatase
MKKVLCVCSAGLVRSTTMAWYLKVNKRYDAIPVGVHKNAPETLDLLGEWADIILVAESSMKLHFPNYQDKIRDLAIGEDIWGVPFQAELMSKVVGGIMELDANGQL